MTDHSPSTVLVIGEALIDIVDRGDGSEPVRHVGGSPLNVAFGLGRLGIPTSFATEYGDDADGDAIAAHLAQAGVAVVRTSGGARRTATALARIQPDGSARYDFDIDWTMRHPPTVGRTPVVHVGSIGALRPPGSDGVLALVESLAEDVLVTLDPNVRPALMPPPSETRALVERYAARAAVVKLSDEDAAWLYPDDAAAAPGRLLAAGAKLVAVTHGAAGSALHTATERVAVPARSTIAVDTIGAGDSYMSGMIAAIIERVGIADALAGALSAERLAEIGAVAAATSSLTVARAGAMPPTAAELQAALEH
ncbi:carbohydrate kinase family protein [Microbacterium sp. 22242]|uniref:carbohydrate kinase family protein n=1 Tax=Microbacterium sp. 22242 TaxID=3453896 RepID=UPI003F84A588